MAFRLAETFLSSPCKSKNSLTIAKWKEGHWCSRNDECQSGRCSNQQICTSSRPNSRHGNHNAVVLRTSGSPCEKNAECDSGRCFRQRCTLANGKLGIGAGCVHNGDCDSGRCDGSGYRTEEQPVCSPLRDVGSPCDEDSDCASGNCSGRITLPFLERRCQA